MKTVEDIKRFKLMIERYTGPGHTIEIDLESGEVCWSDDLLFYQKPKPVKILADREKKDFLKMLKQHEVLNWETRYYDLQNMNGSLWELTLVFEDDLLKIKGTGTVPPQWTSFIDALSQLTGRPIHLEG